MIRSREEEEIQTKIVVHFYKHYEGEISHVANGGWRSKTEAIRLKGMGVKPGYPDLIVDFAPGRSFKMEVKAEGGPYTPSQKIFIPRLQDLGHTVATVRSVEEADRAFKAMGVPAKAPHVRSDAEANTGF